MTPRERVGAALNHQEPDRVPIDLNATTVTSLTIEAYRNLRKHLNLEEDKELAVWDIIQGAVCAREDIMNRYKINTRPVRDPDLKAPVLKTLEDGSFYDDFGVRWKPASYYYDAIERPLTNGDSIRDIENLDWDLGLDENDLDVLEAEAKRLYTDTNYAVVVDFNFIGPFGPFEGACILRGYDKFLLDLYTNQDYAKALIDRLTDLAVRKFNIVLSRIGNYVQVVGFGDDVGMQTGPYISPDLYREFIKPAHRTIFDRARRNTDAKFFLHSCGSVYDFIPDFIEVGVQILNPVQTSAAKMDLPTLKKEFGKDISFWGGGIDIQTQLPFFTPEQIVEQVKINLDIMMPGGGYVFFPSHNIQADVSPDRIEAMFQAVIEFGKY
jgi:uroporphyrinogen decarboxylase